jgi:hypothetical protein
MVSCSGNALGITVYQSRFGFSAAFRTLVANRQGRGVYAHVLMLALATYLLCKRAKGNAN